MDYRHLGNDEVLLPLKDLQKLLTSQFLNRLTSLFETRRQKAHGSIFLTQKRRTGSTHPSTSQSTYLLTSDTRRAPRFRSSDAACTSFAFS